MPKLVLTKPDDWHLHVRDGEYLKITVPQAARCFARALIMPNLKPPVTTITQALNYQARILAALPKNVSFQPLMTLYLTDTTSPKTIIEAKQGQFIYGFKLYPAGATTHSESGVTQIEKIYPILEMMEKQDLPLQIHGEVVDDNIDVFDRERYFIEQQLLPLLKRFSALRVVLEHITTQEAVALVREGPPTLAATITAHHLLLNRNALFKGGINPHHYCLPILKKSSHQKALIQAAISGNAKFFLGTDSAPHPQHLKECEHGCAGIYTSHAALELYAQVFAQANALEKLEGFAGFYGADFYKLPRNQTKITLSPKTWRIPDKIPYGDDQLIPFMHGQELRWAVES